MKIIPPDEWPESDPLLGADLPQLVCRVCGLPMVWSADRNRLVCAIYGNHPKPEPGSLMLAADAEMEALDRSKATRFQRKDRP